MRMDFGLNLEQTQKLIMTPELRQAITVLQMSALELTEYVEQQVLENPLLELRDHDGERAEEAEAARETEPPAADRKEFDPDWVEYFADSSDLGFCLPRGQREVSEQPAYEQFVSQAPTLADHLHMQLSLSRADEELKSIVRYLIGNLDARGYLSIDLAEAAARLRQPLARLQQALAVLQGFEPPGVGARNLQECLTLQLDVLQENNPVVRQLVADHLEDLAAGRLAKIAARLEVSPQEVQRAADILRKLEPKPGRNFSQHDEIRYIVPDVVVEKVAGQYIILVNDAAVPRLTINQTYRTVLAENSAADQNTKQFVEEKLNAAAWLIRSIEQRRLTLYKVANCLVELQRDFLEHGVKYLKPLNLKKVAELVGVHESTVSRATSNKYMQTPQGVFEMKYFFSSGLSDASGAQVSAESLKKILREIIQQEDPANPLSDQKIAELFGQRGINISRRTVTKYRDELGIPATARRKRY
ncbi:RNA polymerase factor sigma-54 [Desulforamulus hydrothermalis]|uniref:RNA polymerase, sigma 54 subunit, RpoN n=1 Tax=Desulforamulus hydrothermalis Lam5 = DSM 18033 TaxID=1121428 RepID=K8DXZ7_9FIRM|nr:RNA polymerase factor sigma-54 [Desulforamulus hydrothermalis]CCO07569.1 RNA polymerase, sigma 54 subunit, RpoN [Desulforamulus hydrothermalis Lam5 = DSM 18033]SHH20906.1 RNA polymerase, sigma 54 subunit, RpoN/SigL [Desulforamulus hydrothermalis Lam5 = DSM 18033]